ncbi:putative SANT/Myb domain, Homeobox-like domain superfamily protein [Plasmopara halstedii]
MASRVPLLVTGKSRKPSRGTVTPRAKPLNGMIFFLTYQKFSSVSMFSAPRVNRSDVTEVRKPAETTTKFLASQDEKLSPRSGKALSFKDPTPTASVINASTISNSNSLAEAKTTAELTTSISKTNTAKATRIVNVAPSSNQDESKDTTAVNSTQLTTSPNRLKTSSSHLPPPVRSPIVLPVQHSERLVKIDSAGPLYRASPVVRPRAGSIGSISGIRPRGTSIGSSPISDTIKQRRLRTLDIKPHQSSRRMLRQSHQSLNPASPLLLGGKLALNLSSVPDIQLNHQSSSTKQSPSTKVTTKKRSVSSKRHRPDVSTAGLPIDTSPRRSSRKRITRSNCGKTENIKSSNSESEDACNEDPKHLELPKEETNMYVPARERATLWAKSLLQGKDELKQRPTKSRKRRSNSNASPIPTLLTAIGGGVLSRSKMVELLQKEPSQMTMGELALTVPKGGRVKLHEREENESNTSSGTHPSNAQNRMRTLSVSSEAAAFAGSIVTPQVQIIDGQMVVVENTIALGDNLNVNDPRLSFRQTDLHNRSSHPQGPGKRWSKEETKHFYYCLSQVGPNFSMMATLFPTRKRRELKNKFKYEEKRHGRLIEIALRASTAPLDKELADVISQMVDKEAQEKAKTKQKRDDDDTMSNVSSVTPQVEFVETMDDDDLFRLNRCGSFDFSG